MLKSQQMPREIQTFVRGDQDRLLALQDLDERLQRYRLVQP